MPAPSDPRDRDNPPPPLQLSTVQGHPDPTRLLNYLYKYPADKEGQELHPDSRTWKVYIDEYESYDYDMVKGFRENIDALLVFAALFSSVVTGFVVSAAERLEPDNAQISTSILFEVTQLLRANGNATLIEATPRSELRPDSITHSTEDVCVAWMFFTSLALSLATALISILAKQWLQAFTALVSGDAKRRSLTRQFRFAGMQKWKFAEIVGFLPLLLHLSLLLFLIGLCVYVERYHWSFLTMLGFVSLAAVAFYVVTAALPAVYLDCPYRIPILFIPMSACVYAGNQLRYYIVNLWSSIQKLYQSLSSLWNALWTGMTCGQRSRSSTTSSLAHGHEELSRDATTSILGPSSLQHRVSQPSFDLLPLSTQEHEHIKKNTRSLEFSSLEWLYTQTTNTSVQRIALHALARALEGYQGIPIPAGEDIPSLRSCLDGMRTFALGIIDSISGPNHLADDIPQLLDFHIHSSNALKGETALPGSRWLSLIESPHLLSFTERRLLPLNDMIVVGGHVDYPLHVACRAERWDIVEKYFDEFDWSQLRKADSDGWLPLGRAAISDKISIELWEKIMRRTEDLTLTLNVDGDRAAHLICYYSADLAKIKSIRGIDWLNIQRRDGQTPLHRLCYNTDNPSHRLEIAKYLLSIGADLSVVDSNQRTPLHYACKESHPAEFIETLCSHLQTVENGQDILNQRSKDGWTALHRAVYFAELDSQGVQALVSAGADSNIVTNNNNLPLHIACCPPIFSSPHREIIAILLDHTNDINKRTKRGETPLDMLMYRKGTKGWQDMYDLMREKGAKPASELESAEEKDSGWIVSNEVE